MLIPDRLIGQTVAGRFLLEELVGQGGMGKVYKARHLELQTQVALKLLKPALLGDPTVVGRFEREAAAASRLHHPNVVSVFEFGRTGPDGTLFIAMEYVEGKDLRSMLRDEWPLAEGRLCELLAQALSALEEAHGRNVIHRDLKPENIMVASGSDGERVKVLDFGIAKILDGDLPALTRNDVVCGTPQYMAPEQATGTGLDARSDLYAMGVILYQLCTGRLPFDGPSAPDVLTQHVNDLPQAPRQRSPRAPISEAMERLILRALEKDPMRRPQSAGEFRRSLLAVGRSALATAPAAPPAPGRQLDPVAALRSGFARGSAAPAGAASAAGPSAVPGPFAAPGPSEGGATGARWTPPPRALRRRARPGVVLSILAAIAARAKSVLAAVRRVGRTPRRGPKPKAPGRAG